MSWVSISALREAAKRKRPGYLEAVLAAGRVRGDRLYLTPARWAELRLEWATADERERMLGQISQAAGKEAWRALYDCGCERGVKRAVKGV